jgi:hypothetical protein
MIAAISAAARTAARLIVILAGGAARLLQARAVIDGRYAQR